MNEIAIIGGGGLGREVLSLVRALPEWTCIGFFDDGKAKGTVVAGLPVLGTVSDVRPDASLKFVVAIGNPQTKKDLIQRLPPELQLATLVHPRALLQDPASIFLEPGVVIGAGCILTTAIRIGRHTLVNLNCTIGHDVVIAAGCSLMPGVHVAGDVCVNEYALVGSGANLLSGITVGAHASIGAGAVVTRSVPAATTVVGVPAKPLQS